MNELDTYSKAHHLMREYSQDQISLIKRTLLDTPNATFTQDELALFINQCKRTGLDPFTRQIYATKHKDKVSIQATIDGLRLIAERSQKYAGQTRPVFFDKDGKEFRVWPKSIGLPYACEVGVLRHDFKEPVYAIAIFDEYAQKNYKGELGFMWAKMPALMIAKVAEALALRRAFPNDLSGIYSSEEISQDPPKEVEPKLETVEVVIDDLPENYRPKEHFANTDHFIETKGPEIKNYVVKVGKFKGKSLKELDQLQVQQYLVWLHNSSKEKGKSLTGDWLEFAKIAESYLTQ